MFDWYRAAPGPQKRAFWATFGGWALEAADAQIFGLVLPTLLAAFALTTGQGGLLASATLICTAIGGWLGGIASDRVGRVRVLQLTIAWYAVATGLLGFSVSFGWLMAFRCLQGFGFGGEWAAGAVLISEYVQARNRGRALASVQSGWAVGWGGALVAYAVVFTALPHNWAWRVLFWLGVLPALLVLVIRRNVSDPAIYTHQTKKTRVSRLFDRDMLRVVVFGALLGLGSHGGYYALTTFLPTYLRKVRDLTVLNTSGYLAVFITASFLGYLASGWVSDRIGRRLDVAVFAILCIASLLIYLLVPLSNTGMLVAGIPLGFFSAGIPGGLGSFFAELFPTGVRGSGMGLCYNLGRIVSAAFPALVGYLAAELGLANSIALFAGIAYAIAVFAALALPETRHRGLPDATDDLAEPEPSAIRRS